MTHIDIGQAVDFLVNKYCTNDPYELAEATGLEIDFQPFSHIKGINICKHDVRILVINSSLPYHEKKFIAAHELGHHILHPQLNYFFITENTLFYNGKYEREANLFAFYLITGVRGKINFAIESRFLQKATMSMIG